MKTISEIQREITNEFNMFENWMQKYEYLIDLGKELPLIETQHKIDENLIKGCQSRVWLHAEKKNDKIIYTADKVHDELVFDMHQSAMVKLGCAKTFNSFDLIVL